MDSLFAQTFRDFAILISDDGSTDATLSILADYKQRYPGRIRILDPHHSTGSARANFARLIDFATADYVMFCDHDDVWLPNKIALSLEKMHWAENEHGPQTPLLVHTDLVVTNSALETVHPSYMRYSSIDPARHSLAQSLMQNTAVGCATLMNRALYERARPFPSEAAIHDCWCTLVAATFGKIYYVDESTILYRRHKNNLIGVAKWNISLIVTLALKTVMATDILMSLVLKSLQAKALLTAYADVMTSEQRKTAAALADLWSLRRTARVLVLLRHGLLMNRLLRNVGLFVAVSTYGTSRRSFWYPRLMRAIYLLLRKPKALVIRFLTHAGRVASRTVQQSGTAEEEVENGSMSYWRCLRRIHTQLEPSLYLEIGVAKGNSLALAKCRAVGVDPEPQITAALPSTASVVKTTSDHFFDIEARTILGSTPDFVFIDGLHHFEQTLRDFIHVELLAAPHSLIIVDDIFPNHQAQAERERRTQVWTGDTWKLHAILEKYRPDLYLLALDTRPTGLLLVAGLDPASRLLWDSYDSIIEVYGRHCGPPREVLLRQAAFPPKHSTLSHVAELLKKCRDGKLRAPEVVRRLRAVQALA